MAKKIVAKKGKTVTEPGPGFVKVTKKTRTKPKLKKPASKPAISASS